MVSLQTDASVGTEMGTMTEPECIGPLDPGTSVTLEGIVWHETDGGMLFILIIWYILDISKIKVPTFISQSPGFDLSINRGSYLDFSINQCPDLNL